MSETVFFRLSSDEDKGTTLLAVIQSLRADGSASSTYAIESTSFKHIPGSPFAYWVREKIQSIFTVIPKLESGGRDAQSGASTMNDFRFLRLWWEVETHLSARDRESTRKGRRWVPIAKGGTYSQYYSDWELVIDWMNDGAILKEEVANYRGSRGWGYNWSAAINGHSFYFRPGLTWPRRTQSGLNVRVLAAGCIIGDKGPAVFVPADDCNELRSLLSIMNSLVFRTLIELQMAFGSYEVGVIERTPVPDLSGPEGAKLGQLALACVNLKRNLDTANEISHVFQLPALLQVPGATLAQRVAAWQARVAETEQQLAAHQREIDEIAFTLYGIAGEDRRAIEASLSGGSAEAASDAESSEPGDDEGESAAPSTDSRPLVVDLFSYAVGCAFGRWDVRFATGERAFAELPDPFAPLPVYAPGALRPESDLSGYPLTIDADGILVDDLDHPDDMARRVQHVLELLWGAQADAIAQEACVVLGVKDVRDYLRKGFFDDHIRRYSKSRRKAPIYWLLQSPRRSYGLWLAYHRLDADMLFKALMHYVEPKLRLEQDRLDALRQQRQAFGSGGKEARQAEKALAQQEALVADVQDLRDRLERSARHYLTPDLNDGVVLTIAPLWELVPWKEAKTYWSELLAGKYEWSSIGKQLRQKGLAK